MSTFSFVTTIRLAILYLKKDITDDVEAFKMMIHFFLNEPLDENYEVQFKMLLTLYQQTLTLIFSMAAIQRGDPETKKNTNFFTRIV